MAEHDTPSISVIVPHYNDLPGLERCLASLMGQEGVCAPFEVVVGDNDSPCGIAAVGRVAAGRARVVLQRHKGAGPARNAAVAAARGDVLAFIDSDCIAQPRWLASGLACLAHAPVVGGRVDVGTPPPGSRTGAEVFEAVFAFRMRDYVEKKGFAGSGNLFCSRATFDKVGGFGTGLSEDVDWSRRARELGLQIIYCDGAAITHPARRDWGELVRKWRRINAETRGLVGSGPDARLRWLAYSLAVGGSWLVHAPRMLTAPGFTPGEKARGLGTLVALRLWRMMDGIRMRI